MGYDKETILVAFSIVLLVSILLFAEYFENIDTRLEQFGKSVISELLPREKRTVTPRPYNPTPATYNTQTDPYIDITASTPNDTYIEYTDNSYDNLAWQKPAFASSYWEVGYPSNATKEKGAWRSAGSTGSWFYVDLGKPETFGAIATNLFVDSNFSDAPVTSYIVSNDEEHWEEVYTEKNYNNKEKRGTLRLIDLSKKVQARYVGLVATDWGGGWADLNTFIVLP